MKLKDYRSPGNENSFYKNIPIEKYSKSNMKRIADALQFPVRVKFRGPRPNDGARSAVARQGTCLRKDAVTFTVYGR